MQLWCIFFILITTSNLWSKPKRVAALCNKYTDCQLNCYNLQFHQNCTTMGLVMVDIDFPNNTLFKGWFVSDFKLHQLLIYMNNVDKIEMDAFNSSSFSTVIDLDIKTSLKSLDNGIFNGFTSLRYLFLTFTSIPEFISTDFLNGPSATLRLISIYGQSNNILKLDNITGSGALSALEDMYVRGLLNDSITKKSFVGLTNIKRIKLDSCHITSIGGGSFDSLGPNLTSLVLTNNKITTLPNDLFQRILLNANLKIYLQNNEWKCDCHLINFQSYLTDYHQQFDESSITCKSPSEKEFDRVKDTIIEQDGECFLAKECYSDFAQQNTGVTVYLNVPSSSISLVQTNTAELVLSSQALSNIPTFIWYRRQEPNSVSDVEINCIQGFNTTINTTLLSENVPYTFCYINKETGKASLFDCITYIKIGVRPNLWYSDNSKVHVIEVIIASLLLSFLVGIVVGIQFIKMKLRVKDLDCVYSYATHINSISIESNVPHLPDRPNSIYETDPDYAHVV